MVYVRPTMLSTFVRKTTREIPHGIRANHGHRSFATAGPSSQQATPRWLIASIGLGIPITFYMWQRDTTPTTNPRGANQEYQQSAEGNNGNGSPAQKQTGTSAFAHDEPRGMGTPSGPGSMSYKQEGWSNGDAMNPYVNEPGKSKKGEGETETVKVKGTVRTDRPQV
ncbi:hypothetical protein N7541_011956 [Penicillium brevicompactum]|uniref:Uncharacterized protein n=2 Tax=Penicillium brevicompactum TaxID=5074 RepID=A0A9W9UJ21_PENBR|nr:hypothetical protein N7541_011956 [Penicillium brevicompactum]